MALSLPEDDEQMIREKVIDEIGLDDGLSILLDFYDNHLANDDFTDILVKFEDCDYFEW